MTGRPLTEHFADTTSPLPDYEVAAFALQIPPEATAERVARRVEAQFRRASWTKCAGCWRPVFPRPLIRSPGSSTDKRSSLLEGVRDEAATRELIVRENRHYARRQLIWFRKEPNLQWIYAAGEREDTQAQVASALAPGVR